MTPDLSAVADVADDLHHRDLTADVAALYRFDTPAGPITQADFLDLLSAAGEKSLAPIERALISDEIAAYKAYLLCVCRNRRLFAKLIARANVTP